MPDEIGLCARIDFEFHTMLYEALGIPVFERDGSWWVERPATVVLMDGGTVTDAAQGAIPPLSRFRDSWGRLTLPLPWRSAPDQPWMIRPPGPIDVPPVPGLIVRRADDAAAVLRFERSAVDIGGGLPGHVDGAIHPAGPTAANDRLHLFTGTIDDEVVATALAAVTNGGLSIGAISTRKEWRRRGIGAAMTAAAVAVNPELPATLTASVLGLPIYRRLGFRDIGPGIVWHHPDVR
jgi:GNAT superfamily N-acetyltransferase